MGSEYIFLDTSALYAYFDEDDNEHKKVKDVLEKREEEFVTSNYIIDELVTLLRARKIPVEKFQNYIESLFSEKMCLVYYVDKSIELAAWAILKKYKDHVFSFTDCTSFSLIQEQEIKKACTLDKHFSEFGVEVFPVS